jgi:Secretion system C-terminal sorting domain
MDIMSTNPYQVKLNASGSFGNYTWSNGANGQVTTVTEGGPYMVTVTYGGCSVTKTVNVPKSPESLIWIFPTGCYTNCDTTPATLIGPNQPVKAWDWLWNHHSENSGTNGYVPPFNLQQSGTYNLMLNTGFYDYVSNELHYTLTECRECELIIDNIRTEPTNNHFCTSTVSVTITNASTEPIPVTITNPSDQVILFPSSFSLPTGTSTITFTVTPIYPQAYGAVTLMMKGFDKKNNRICVNPIAIELEQCGSVANKVATNNFQTTFKPILSIAPNPSKGITNINYTTNSENSILELYSILGRLVSNQSNNTNSGSWLLDTCTMPSGVYIVVLKDANGIQMQQKLIVQ